VLAASTMAKAMHHYMVKSSAGMFRARFVVPMCDWPKILDEYDTPSATADDSAGRTRLGADVLVTELASPQNTNRVLCVTAHTASVFVDVLHRLLCGLAGNREAVATRLLVGRADLESATVANGGSGIGAVVDELQRAAAVNISEGFERFHVYPLAGETALRIVGRPSAVVHCVCLVNELLCETATAAATRLVAAGRRPSRREDAIRSSNLGWSVFAPVFDQNSLTSHIATASYWPAADPRLATPIWSARRVNQYPPLSPIDTYSDFPAADARPVPPVLDARLTDQYSPLSPTETNSDWPAVDARPTTSVWSASERLPDQYSPQGPINTTTDWPPVDPRLCTSTPIWTLLDRCVIRNQSPRLANATATRPVIPIRPVSNRLIMNRQSSPSRITTNVNTTRPTTSIPSVSNRLVNRNPSGLITATTAQTTTVITNSTTTAVTASPITFAQSLSDYFVDRDLPLRPNATTANSANDRHATPIQRISIKLIVNQQPSSSGVTTNATATTNRRSTSDRRFPIRLFMNQQPSPSNVATTATTSTTVSTTNTTTSTTGQSENECRDSSQTVPLP